MTPWARNLGKLGLGHILLIPVALTEVFSSWTAGLEGPR